MNERIITSILCRVLQAVLSTAGTRVVLPAPILIIPPVIMSLLEKYVSRGLFLFHRRIVNPFVGPSETTFGRDKKREST